VISNIEINKSIDLEAVWLDANLQPLNVTETTFEIYHYDPKLPAEIKATLHEPYIITQTISDTLGITSVNDYGVSGMVSITSAITLELDLTVDQLAGLGCPPNDYVIPGTNSKVSIVSGNTMYALSAWELAALINLQASGYYAVSDDNGFLVLKTDTLGHYTNITIDYGTLNPIIGLPEGVSATGKEVALIFNQQPTEMVQMAIGKFVYPDLYLSSTTYESFKRYYIVYRTTDPNIGLEITKEEDFVLVESIKPKLNFSFNK